MITNCKEDLTNEGNIDELLLPLKEKFAHMRTETSTNILDPQTNAIC
jgi:hypothetical protein